MAVNIQTIKEIRNYLLDELHDIYPVNEIKAMSSILIQKFCNIKKTSQLYEQNSTVSPEIISRIETVCKELKAGRPLQYILGETEFYHCPILVNEHVLIPRPETEELVDIIIKENRGYEGTIIDFCTGSGCIAIALAVHMPGAKVLATDISGEAIELARHNAKLNCVEAEFFVSDVFDNNTGKLRRAGIIVSNPPYVLDSEKILMHRNVVEFEPHTALFVPDNDPLIFYRALLNKSAALLVKGGRIYFEINEAMGGSMTSICKEAGFSDIRVIKDINGRDRIVSAVRHG